MSIFNMTKQTNSNIKDVSLALVLIGSLIGALTVSTSVTAAPLESVEKAVSNFVVAQGEQIISELNTQLQQSIDKEIKTFTANFSLNNKTTWLVTEPKVKETKLSLNKTNINSLQLTSN
ncbi:hypothetical protein CXF85_19000 [Colwellia sp. 75C3]|uniref:hypothetical protein n=1 Tax=Colwellia sp. 75C3 TaxID=888425 RepID=UPI000C34A862|nr:hypothetical protein [Colwellia sp. 75C3]PKG81546.1 hypothetical protein CXF85_19000 [Colwellia sp. 75C3]